MVGVRVLRGLLRMEGDCPGLEVTWEPRRPAWESVVQPGAGVRVRKAGGGVARMARVSVVYSLGAGMI